MVSVSPISDLLIRGTIASMTGASNEFLGTALDYGEINQLLNSVPGLDIPIVPQTWYMRKVLDQSLLGRPVDRFNTQVSKWNALLYGIAGYNLKVDDVLILRNRLDVTYRQMANIERKRKELEETSQLDTSLDLAKELRLLDSRERELKKELRGYLDKMGLELPEDAQKRMERETSLMGWWWELYGGLRSAFGMPSKWLGDGLPPSVSALRR